MEILFIESDPEIESFLSSMIRYRINDARITRADDHRTAMQILENNAGRFSVILTDNGTDSKKFLNELSELNRFGIPIVILGSDTSERAVVEAMRRGAADYISRRNLKFEKLPLILQRAAAEKEEWALVNSIRTNRIRSDSYLEIEQQILQHLEEDRLERNRQRVGQGQMISLPSLHEGFEYNLILVYCVFSPPVSPGENLDDRVLQARENLIRSRLEEIVPEYGGQLWGRGNRFLLTAMPIENPIQSVLLALEFRSVLQSIVVQHEELPAKIKSGIGIASDRLIYREKKGEIISSGINLAAHLAFKEIDNDGFVITSNLLNELGKRTMYYFREIPEFEGRKVHRYEFIS